MYLNSRHGIQYFNTFSSGVIRNTVVLNYSVSHSYILSVVAYDCGMRRSEPLLVRVEVKKACNTGWTGKSLTYRQKVYRVRQFRIEQNAEVVVCS